MKDKIIKKLKGQFKYLIYISIVFVIIVLIKGDFLKTPEVYNYWFLLFSLLLLFSGFIFQCLNWYFILKKDYPISIKDAVISFGLYVFTKYIPGKVLVIIGKAGHINKTYKYPNKGLILRSLDAQFIVLWTGIIIGSIGLLYTDDTIKWGLPLIFGWIILSLIIFTDIFHKLFVRIIKILTNKEFNIPLISFKEVFKVLPVFFIYWINFTAAFYFFALSLSESYFSFSIAFGFPLAVTLGIIMLIAPGGIGFREGILIAYLTMLSMGLDEATTISVMSRLWFLIGEFFIFSLAVVLNLYKKKHTEKQEVSKIKSLN